MTAIETYRHGSPSTVRADARRDRAAAWQADYERQLADESETR